MALSIKDQKDYCGSRMIPKDKGARIANVSVAPGSSNVGQPYGMKHIDRPWSAMSSTV
jgi:hypothetical protein